VTPAARYLSLAAKHKSLAVNWNLVAPFFTQKALPFSKDDLESDTPVSVPRAGDSKIPIPIRTLDISPSGGLIAYATDGCVIRVVDLNDGAIRVSILFVVMW
jgi:hypothetical protein